MPGHAAHGQSVMLNSLTWDASHRGAYREGMPAQYRAGLGFLDLYDFRFGLDYGLGIREATDHFHAGLERSFLNLIYCRAGYRWSWREISENRLSAGIGSSTGTDIGNAGIK